jgi:hypothetical protein
MRKVKSLTKFISVGMLGLILGTLGEQVALAQRPIFLLDLTCIKTDNSTWGFLRQSQDIVVGREIHTSIIRSASNAAMTCKLPEASSAFLRLEYGMSDTDSNRAPVKIDAYLDGNQIASRTASPGQRGTMLVDISQGKSLSIETSCARASNCGASVYFFKAQIEPAAASPGRRQ